MRLKQLTDERLSELFNVAVRRARYSYRLLVSRSHGSHRALQTPLPLVALATLERLLQPSGGAVTILNAVKLLAEADGSEDYMEATNSAAVERRRTRQEMMDVVKRMVHTLGSPPVRERSNWPDWALAIFRWVTTNAKLLFGTLETPENMAHKELDKMYLYVVRLRGFVCVCVALTAAFYISTTLQHILLAMNVKEAAIQPLSGSPGG